MFALQYESPESPKVQQVIARHYAIIRTLWGASNLEDKQGGVYAGLGQLYASDERYTMVNGKPQPEFALFMQKAMRYFAETELK